MTYPLDGEMKIWKETDTSAMYEYFVKIVPTAYEDILGQITATNQFSVMKYVHRIPLHDWTARGVPGTLALNTSTQHSRLFRSF